MRAVAIEEFGGPEQLRAMELPRPSPAPGEVLVRVVSAGVNPVDVMICAGGLDGLLPHGFPLVPGWDVAGAVEELGDGASRFRKGDRVWAYARKPEVRWGCYAEYVAVPESVLAPMPAKLLFEEAASVPLAALTAYQCLFGGGSIGAGSTVLIHAASGGVGHFAVQLARDAGAQVLGTAGTSNQEFVFALGAHAAIDYTREDFVEAVRRHCSDGVDLVLDAVGEPVTTRSFSVIKAGGRLISIVDRPDAELARSREVDARFLFAEPNAGQLEWLARMIDQKRLRTHVQKIFALADAAEALKTVGAGHVRGKLVLNL